MTRVPVNGIRKAFETRAELKNAQRVVVKLGSAVLTREDGESVALGRIASIVEQVAALQNEGREMLMVSSGSRALGNQRIAAQMRLSMSMRETLSAKESIRKNGIGGMIDGRPANPRVSSAVGQTSLMALYELMFSQYGVNVAQVCLYEFQMIIS